MKRIGKLRIIPIAAVDNEEDGLHVAEALQKAGLDIIEFTLRCPAAEPCIKRVLKAFPNMLVGAGTLLNVDHLQRAIDAGAKFGVAPGLNEVVMSKAFEMHLPFIPGVMTCSEISRAIAVGCKQLKFFPAEALGGVRLLQAISVPFEHTGVRFIPTGGITVENAAAYLDLPLVSAVAGTWIVPRDVVQLKNWNEITRLAMAALSL
ncbi:MAG: bifunctional 4-hydroxy-2-oxoglutarate aldolase/2-dehydro-3-deoxy-phosphogluconate aldolase [Kiritimatiellae bacterium]|nr:bifunctional 4-hydroxy-2-oxoglutarate aldolase/2-dehydro-3-deoxy-phosphogluconate aldolase [Kiritimatiellia bacterium]